MRVLLLCQSICCKTGRRHSVYVAVPCDMQPPARMVWEKKCPRFLKPHANDKMLNSGSRRLGSVLQSLCRSSQRGWGRRRRPGPWPESCLLLFESGMPLAVEERLWRRWCVPGTPAQLASCSGLQDCRMMNSAMWSHILFYSSPLTSDELRSEWVEYMKVSQHQGRVRENTELNFQLSALVNGNEKKKNQKRLATFCSEWPPTTT